MRKLIDRTSIPMPDDWEGAKTCPFCGKKTKNCDRFEVQMFDDGTSRTVGFPTCVESKDYTKHTNEVFQKLWGKVAQTKENRP